MNKFARWFFGAKNTVESTTKPRPKPRPKFFKGHIETHYEFYNRLILKPSAYISDTKVEDKWVFDCPRCKYELLPLYPDDRVVCPKCKLGIQRAVHSSGTIYLGEVTDEWLEAYPIEQD